MQSYIEKFSYHTSVDVFAAHNKHNKYDTFWFQSNIKLRDDFVW